MTEQDDRIKEFARAFRQVLDDRWLTVRAVEEVTGVSRNTVSLMSRGYVPTFETMVKIIRGLRLPALKWLALSGHRSELEGLGIRFDERA